jgi:hypothetical protein
MITKIKAGWNFMISIFTFGKKKSKEPLNDAVRFPEMIEKHILEDFELAAYHNQA